MRRRSAAVALVLALLVTACGSDTTAVGVVTAYDGDLQTVNSFSMRTLDGLDLTFQPGDEGAFDFPLPHLQEHLASGDRIRVTWEEQSDGTLIAVAIADA